MTPEQSVEEIASKLTARVTYWIKSGNSPSNIEAMLSEDIANALRAERNDKADRIASLEAYRRMYAAKVPPGHVLYDGVVRKVLGTLPVTKDGVVTMPGIEVFHPDQCADFALVVSQMREHFELIGEWPLPDDCEWVAEYWYSEPDTGYVQFEVRDLRTCYSTRDAAEAAAKEVQGE